jgi:hypothetical protein
MKKVYISGMLLFAILLVAASCGSNTKTTTSTGYIGGTDGLSVAYSTDMPPAKIMDNDQETFSIGLDLENKGEYRIQTNEIIATVTGIDLNAFGIASDTIKNSGTLEPKTKKRVGDKEEVMSGTRSFDIVFNAGYKKDLPADLPFNIVTNVCYRYQTKATAPVCLRKDVIKKGDEKDVCKIGDLLTASNSGAPLQVTSITEQKGGGANKISLIIEIENKGKGVAYLSPDALSASKCSETGTDMKSLRDKIRVSVSFEGNKPAVSCSTLKGANTGVVPLIGGKTARVMCELDTSMLQDTTYTDIPNIVIDYVYKDSVSQQVIVQDLG